MYNKKTRLVFSNDEIEKHFGPHVVIADTKWFVEHADEIETWLNNSTESWSLQGVVITFNSKQDQLLFKLAWNEC
jgi:hypothetical protein